MPQRPTDLHESILPWLFHAKRAPCCIAQRAARVNISSAACVWQMPRSRVNRFTRSFFSFLIFHPSLSARLRRASKRDSENPARGPSSASRNCSGTHKKFCDSTTGLANIRALEQGQGRARDAVHSGRIVKTVGGGDDRIKLCRTHRTFHSRRQKV